MRSWECSAAGASDAAALNTFFERTGSGCHCQYWHFAGDKNAWLERLAHAPSENARALSDDLGAAAPGELRGVVARALDPSGNAERPILGWMKLTAAPRVAKLYEQRVYKGLPCFQSMESGGEPSSRTDVLTVGCFLVDPSHRRQGIARELLRAGLRIAAHSGAQAVEAFPRRGELLGEEEQWMGPIALFEAEGFCVVSHLRPYPVMRKVLS